MKKLKLKADKLFSQYIRSLGKCEWCGRRNGVQLQCAHIFSRRFLVTRWLDLNAMCLCAGCHRKAHDNPIEFTEFVKKELGELAYEDLRTIAKTATHKVIVEEVIEELKTKLKEAK